MKISKTTLDGVLIVEPDCFEDVRGAFMETYHEQRYSNSGISPVFVQDNLSYSVHGTLRGLHYQFDNVQAKLVQVIDGEIYDVAVDVRYGSPTFGQWIGVYLSSDNKKQLFIPEGFAHGFCVTSDRVIFMYKCSDFYTPESEGGILWSDPELSIDWPIATPILSEKDQKNPLLNDIGRERLPAYNINN
jgi:dTDP-4-dehydrorhamnose 3,5-epimerase